MKKTLSILASGATYLALTSPVFAASVGVCPLAGTAFAGLCTATISTNFIPALIGLLFALAVVIAVIYLIWGGIKWIMSGGDKQALQTAREHVIAAIVGLVLVFLTYFIINFIIKFILPGSNVSLTNLGY